MRKITCCLEAGKTKAESIYSGVSGSRKQTGATEPPGAPLPRPAKKGIK
jgi:hypothetical protein